MSNQKLNIALLSSHLEDEYAKTLCKGAMIAAEEMDVNLFIIPGRYFDSNYEDKERTKYKYQYDTLFSYVNSQSVDGLIIMTETIGSTWSYERKSELLRRFSDLPVINIGPDMEGHFCVKFDNKTGLREGIEHLIKEHKRKKIGFLSGPITNKDAVERLQVYKDTLTANGMEISDKLIAYGSFTDSCIEQTEKLIQDNPDIDAIVFSNDRMAIGGYTAISELGLKIGTDISVMGFDDSAEAISVSPKLTTVRADATEIGYRSLMEVMNLIQFGRMKKPVVDSRLIIRGSCGCRKNGSYADINDCMKKLLETPETMLASNITDFIFENYNSSLPVNSYKMSLYSFFNMLIFKIGKSNIQSNEISDNIISRLDSIINSKFTEYVPIENFFYALNMVCRYTMFKNSMYSTLEKQIILSELFTNIYSHITTRYAIENTLHTNDIEYLSWLTNSLTRDMLLFIGSDKCYGSVSKKLSGIKMKSSYIFTFKNPINHKRNQKWIPPEKIYLKSYHNTDKTEIIPTEKQKITTDDIFRNEYLPSDRQYTMVLSTLYSNEDQYGLFLCEIDYEHFYYIAPITVQLCASIKTMNLIAKQEITQKKLQQSLEKIKQNNVILDNISKSDELTEIYNRRGFFEMTQTIISDRRNLGLPENNK
jgi:DNA-binding LacI/PurR family transcriptional regulator